MATMRNEKTKNRVFEMLLIRFCNERAFFNILELAEKKKKKGQSAIVPFYVYLYTLHKRLTAGRD